MGGRQARGGADQVSGSKSDKFNTGSVKWMTVAAEDCLCPVAMFCEYWDATEALGFEMDMPLFRHYDGKLVTSRQVVDAIKRQAVSMGLDPKHFAGHSLRIGGATAMTAADLSMYDKMQQGGWQSLEASLCYMRRSAEMEKRVTAALQLPKRSPLTVLRPGNLCPSTFSLALGLMTGCNGASGGDYCVRSAHRSRGCRVGGGHHVCGWLPRDHGVGSTSIRSRGRL